MCGVVISRHVFKKAMDRIHHRGTRCTSMETKKGWIAHSRLPIVGLGFEYDQPVNVDQWTMAFVGQLLDFRDRDPKAECDLGLVIDTFIESGPAGFQGFDGFWSVVAIDNITGDLWFFTDFLGIKPLYYRTDVQIAASEPDAVLVAGPVTLDEVYLSSVIKFGYCPETWRTPYNEVRKTRPGECIVYTEKGELQSTITDPLHPIGGLDLKSEIKEAVRRRVVSSDVPVAALVSGGVDSSIVYTLAQRYGEVEPYHVLNNETENLLKVAPDAITLGFDEVSLDQALAYMQEPIDLGSLLPQVALSDALADRETVCLTGDGADEFFGGYGRASRYDSQQSDVFHELVAWHLPRLDRVMMRNRVEVRSPFLARRVAQAALALPWLLRRDKNHLRDLFRDDLPPGVADTPKKALRTPIITVEREANSARLVELFRRNFP
jgi:asparagine synthase (glutamine-hydrolysing)